MNPLFEAMGDVGYLMDTPGAYLRGALSGNLGQRASGQDMLQSWGLDAGPMGGMAAEMVADPFALAGLAGGAYKGIQGLTKGAQALSHADDVNPLMKAAAGFVGNESGVLDMDEVARRLGGSGAAAELAAFQGPRYSTSADDLKYMLGSAGIRDEIENEFFKNKDVGNFVASEIPGGSRLLGSGAEGVTFKTPMNSVVRVNKLQSSPMGRLEIPEMLQPFRSVHHGGFTVEHLPMVHPVDNLRRLHGGLGPHYEDAEYRILKDLESRGIADLDWNQSNVGLTNEGNLLAHDPGVFQVRRGFDVPSSSPMMNSDPTEIQQAMLGRAQDVGIPDLIRRTLAQDARSGSIGQGVPVPELEDLIRRIRGF